MAAISLRVTFRSEILCRREDFRFKSSGVKEQEDNEEEEGERGGKELGERSDEES